MEELIFDEKRLAEIARQAGFKPKKMAALCHTTPWQLRRVFRRLLGCSPREYLMMRRAVEVEKLLREHQVVKIATIEAGFTHPPSFCRWFKARVRITPGEFASLACSRAPENGTANSSRPKAVLVRKC